MSYYTSDKGALVEWAADNFARLYREGGGKQVAEAETRSEQARTRAIGLIRSQQCSVWHIAEVTGLTIPTVRYVARKNGLTLPDGRGRWVRKEAA